MNSYSAYQSTGIEWMPAVPKHWQVRPLAFAGEVMNGYPFDSKKFDATKGHPLVRIRDIFSEATETRFDGDWVQAAEINTDDVLIGMDGDFNVGVWKGGKALLNQRVCCVRTDSPALSRYLSFVLPMPLQVTNDLTYATTVKHLSSFDVLKYRIPIPPINEVEAIAAYLDAETKRIDELIKEKDRLISALAELKQVVLSEYISFGVVPEVPVKSSGSNWFPQIPETWEIKRLKFIVRRIEQGWSPQAEARPATDGEWGVLKAGACNGGQFREDEQKALPSFIDPDLSLEVREGDVLMSRGSGSVDLVGSVALVGQVRPKLMLSDLLYRLSVDDPNETNTQWLVMALGSAPLRRQIRLSLRGAEGLTRKVTIEDIKELILPVPPKVDQDEIVAQISAETDRLLALISHANSEVILLKELRASTITDAVLGRIDVRKNANTEPAKEAIE